MWQVINKEREQLIYWNIDIKCVFFIDLVTRYKTYHKNLSDVK